MSTGVASVLFLYVSPCSRFSITKSIQLTFSYTSREIPITVHHAYGETLQTLLSLRYSELVSLSVAEIRDRSTDPNIGTMFGGQTAHQY